MRAMHDRQFHPPIRLWPGIAAAALLVLARVVLPTTGLLDGGTAVLGGLVGGLLVMVWWLFFSRASWGDRLLVVALMVVGVWGTSFLVHESIDNGMMGMMLPLNAFPALSVVLVVSVWAVQTWLLPHRRWIVAATILLTCSAFLLIRTGGMTGAANSDLHWRWTSTPEQRLLAQAPPTLPTPAPPTEAPPPVPAEPMSSPQIDAAAGRGEDPVPEAPEMVRVEWAGFRGSARDSHVGGVRLNTDWATAPPQELWRQPIGPGWSSFAVAADLIYTQEQRGEDEIVAAYSLKTGAPVWMHRDAARFWESNGGAGPRGTPTLSQGRVYALGATGIINALDASTGSVVWSRDAANDTGAPLPGWGFSSSPLVVDDLVIAATGGRLIAYDVTTGDVRWLGPDHSGGYSSPQLFTIDDVPQIILMSDTGATSVAPADGSVLWEYAWEGTPIVQPAALDDGDLLVTTADAMGGIGLRRLGVTNQTGTWTLVERWASRSLKPYFNDFVVHQGYAYGFDGAILACVDLSDGTRVWKGGRYGNGQMILLSDQNVMVVLSEDGDLALVSATPAGFTEMARFSALDAKTWNHPALVGDTLLVRNGEEMVAFRLSLFVR